MNEKFWNKMFIDLNDKWHALQYNILLMREATQCRVDRLKLESFTGDGDVGLKEAKAAAEAYAAIYELMREMRNEDNKSEMSGQD